MRNPQTLEKSILLTEFELASECWERLQREGYGPVKTAAIIYKHGRLDARKEMKTRVDDAFLRLSKYRKALIDNGIPLPDANPVIADEKQEVSTDE